MSIQFTPLNVGGSSSGGTSAIEIPRLDSIGNDLADLIENNDLHYQTTRVPTNEEIEFFEKMVSDLSNEITPLGFRTILKYETLVVGNVYFKFDTFEISSNSLKFSLIMVINEYETIYNVTYNRSGDEELIFTKNSIKSNGIPEIIYSDIFSSYLTSATILPTNQQKIITPNSEEKEFLKKIIEMNKQGRLPSIILVSGVDNFTFTVSQCSNSMLRLHTFYGDGDISGLSISYSVSQNRLTFERIYATSSGSSGSGIETLHELSFTLGETTSTSGSASIPITINELSNLVTWDWDNIKEVDVYLYNNITGLSEIKFKFKCSIGVTIMTEDGSSVTAYSLVGTLPYGLGVTFALSLYDMGELNGECVVSDWEVASMCCNNATITLKAIKY